MKVQGKTDSDILDVHSTSQNDKMLITFGGGGNRLIVGPDCHVFGSFNLKRGSTLIIGAGTTSTGPIAFFVYEGTTVSIGENCLFSNTVIFRPSDAHRVYDAMTKKRINIPANITLGRHVWVGEHVSILKGAHIPDDCVVGTRSC